jgi:hypothetical protein
MTAQAADASVTRTYPMTRAAWEGLRSEIAVLVASVQHGHEAGVELDDDGLPAPVVPDGLPLSLQEARLAGLEDVLQHAAIVEAPGTAVIGRTVRAREEDGTEVTYGLVVPGDGDVRHRRVSVASPIGCALVGSHAGDVVTVSAPCGTRRLTVLEVRPSEAVEPDEETEAAG